MVITGKHILHSAFYLAATLLCVAMYFILLRADFLAAVQILVYMGAIVVLILFALMLTRTKVGQETNISNNQKVFAALIAIILFVSLTIVFSYAKINTVAENATTLKVSSVKEFAGILFTKYTLPFEIASILLLAALVGSIVIAMKEKQETEGNDIVKDIYGGSQDIYGGAQDKNGNPQYTNSGDAKSGAANSGVENTMKVTVAGSVENTTNRAAASAVENTTKTSVAGNGVENTTKGATADIGDEDKEGKN